MDPLDKPLPNDDPKVQLTIRLIMQGKLEAIGCKYGVSPITDISFTDTFDIESLGVMMIIWYRISFVMEMSSGSSSISSSPSSSLDSCRSLIISASSRVPQTVMLSSAAMYSLYVQSGANIWHVSSSHSRVKVK
uniref:Uncharacterized protein n=1 Tax=Timema poppense TaxID=170557 RepID=A0A7R9D3E3_TIMPO|nr:unnamed protein product [Timema poppensis]